MQAGGGGSRELVTLQSDIERNTAIVAQLQHDIRAATATHTSVERAQRTHLDTLRAELRRAASEASLLESYATSPKVASGRVHDAERIFTAKKRELDATQHEIRVIESVLKQFIHDGSLQLAELFDVHDSQHDRIALDMILDRRGR